MGYERGITEAEATSAAVVLADIAESRIMGRAAGAGTGPATALTPAQARTAAELGSLATQNGTFSGTSSGTNTGDQTSVSGNAGSATVLETGRNINGVLFNGSADVTVPAAGSTLTDAVPNAKLDTMAANTVKANNTGGVATPTDVAIATTFKTALTLVKGDVGLGSVDNTSDASKPVSTATQTALDLKQATLVSGTNIKTINGSTLLGSGNLAVSADVKQTEIDFGTTPVSEASFLITDADVSAGSHLIGSVAYVAPTGKDLDELEMDGLDLKFAPGSGDFTLYVRGMDGYVADKFKINYMIG